MKEEGRKVIDADSIIETLEGNKKFESITSIKSINYRHG